MPDPCHRTVNVETGGIDGATQRVGLRAIDIAACTLGTTREQLLTSAAASLSDSRELPPGSETAIRDGLEQAIEEEKDAGRLNPVAAWLLSPGGAERAGRVGRARRRGDRPAGRLIRAAPGARGRAG